MEGLTYKRERIGRRSALSQPGTVLPESACSMPDLQSLLNAVHAEIIPRLVETYRTTPPGGAKPTQRDIDEMSALAVAQDPDGALAIVAAAEARGASIQEIYVELLGGVARQLGAKWENDTLPFIDVAVGLCTLHQVIFRLQRLRPAERVGPHLGRVLFAPAPGESHVFGVLVLSGLFSNAGWQTWSDLELTRETMLERVVDGEFDVVGLSMSADRHAPAVRDVIAGIRKAAMARPPLILVGGSSFERTPLLIDEVGADGSAPNALAAVDAARDYIERRRLG